MAQEINLVLPGLFDLPLQEFEPKLLAQELPNLNRLLRFAAPQPNQDFSIDAILQSVLALETRDKSDFTNLPLAQAIVDDDNLDSACCLLFAAVNLLPDLHNAILVPIPPSEHNLKSISVLIDDLGKFFSSDCDIRQVADGLYLLQLKRFKAPTHYPHLLSVLGKAVNPYIEQSRQILSWYQLVNEMQMFMHQHPLNQQRLTNQQIPINSLWFWGAGVKPEVNITDLGWYCDDPVLNQFALSLGLRTDSVTNLNAIVADKNALVIDLRLIQSMKTEPDAKLEQLLLELDCELLMPLLKAVKHNRYRLILRAGFGIDYALGAFSALRFWRPPRDLLTAHKYPTEF